MTKRKRQTEPVIQAEINWLTVAEFIEISGLSSDQVRELVEIGVFAPSGGATSKWLFSHQTVTLARKLRCLQEDLDLHLDLPTLALTYRLLERISELEHQLCRERAAQLCDR
jgi:DNA-binding transcriptional MerR regulator